MPNKNKYESYEKDEMDVIYKSCKLDNFITDCNQETQIKDALHEAYMSGCLDAGMNSDFFQKALSFFSKEDEKE